MRLPRPRLTVRRLMIGVALLGSILAIGIEWNKRVKRLQRRAFYHRVNSMGSELDLGASFERKRAWNAEMAIKYDHYASRPWLSVPPDPPPPERPGPSTASEEVLLDLDHLAPIARSHHLGRPVGPGLAATTFTGP